MTKNTRLYERFLVIILALQGKTYAEISEITCRSVPTICKYVKSFREKGLVGLKMKYSTGRRSKLTPEQKEKLLEVIVTKTPASVGLPANMNWTAPLMCSWVKKEFGVEYSDRGMRTLLYSMNLSFTVPTYTLAKADPKKQEEFIKRFQELKEKLLNETIDRILFVDETMIRDYQAISRTWFPKGKQKIIPTFGKHWGTKIIGSLDYETGEVTYTQEDQYTAKEFLIFLKMINEKYKGERIVIILDNARIHHAKLLEEFLTKNKETLSLEFLPPYSPNLNLIEGLWGWMKNSVINNVFFDSAQKISKAVNEFIQEINKTPEVTIDRLCVKL